MTYQTGKLYKIKSDGVVDAADGAIGIRLNDASLSCTIYGSQNKKTAIGDMENIRAPEDIGPITAPGWYNFNTLPNYIAFVGTAAIIETTNIILEEISDIS